MTTPAKPTPDFPLFPHRNGQWAKKIKGKLRYFGSWADPDAALARYHGLTPAKIASQGKPAKPSENFPLFPHNCGQWAKKIKGKTHYFGPWADPDAALKRWTAEKDDLLAGRVRSRATSLDRLELSPQPILGIRIVEPSMKHPAVGMLQDQDHRLVGLAVPRIDDLAILD